MKLYATTTSERGKPVSKSGNEWVDIVIIDDNREVIGHIHVKTFQDSAGGGIKVFHQYAEHVYVSEDGKDFKKLFR